MRYRQRCIAEVARGAAFPLSRKVAALRLRVGAGFIAALLVCNGAWAQGALSTAPPSPLTVDANGVELASVKVSYSEALLTIGRPGAGGITYARSFVNSGWRDTLVGTINSGGSTYTVSLGDNSEHFTLSSGVYTSTKALGSTLTFSSGAQIYTYTTRDGTTYTFDKALAGNMLWAANEGRLTTITAPSRQVTTLTYKTVTAGGVTARRLQSVNDNLGYQLHFDYALNSPASSGDLTDWQRTTVVTGLNGAIDYCSPTADTCSFSQSWPQVTFTNLYNSSSQSMTDALGHTRTYAFSGVGLTVTQPQDGSHNITRTWTQDGGGTYIATFSDGVGTWHYSYADGGGNRTVTVIDPNSNTRVYVVDLTSKLVSTRTDALSMTTSYSYDGNGRVTQVAQPEGNSISYTYDSRGNVTQTTVVKKSGSGLSNIVTTSGFDSSCSNPVTCNQPNWTRDARGNQTDYTYDSTHGGVLTATAPAPGGSGPYSAIRPQTRTTYTSFYAYYKNSGGSIVAAASPVYLPTGISECATTSSCSGGSDEVKTTIDYGSTGVANNRLPASLSVGSGNGSLTAVTAFTFDAIGNLLTADWPLPGATDTIRLRYDAGGRLIGVIAPDPDGGGSLKFRAKRLTYDYAGEITASESGTVNSQSDGDWAAFSSLQQVATTFNSTGRPTVQAMTASGTTYTITQYSYDSAGRLDCVTVRMNPSVFGSITGTAACVLGTTGSAGPDQISKYGYDAADHQTSLISGYASAAQQYARKNATFTDNGLLATITDAKDNKTTYEYDGVDRLSKIRYPNTTTGSLTSSSTDFKQYAYDATSNVTQVTTRDSQNIAFSFDNLNRQTQGLLSTAYVYDNLNRVVSLTLPGNSAATITYAWDALSRKTSETTALGTVSYQYDLANRRTRMTWPDSLYVDYVYDDGGHMTAIRENGATSGLGLLATFTFDDLGRRTSVSRGNGVSTAYGYDAISRLTSLVNDLSSTGYDQTYNLTYSAGSQALTRTRSNSAYDHYTGPPGSTQTINTTVNGLNQLVAVGAASLTHNGRGDLTSDGTNTYSYDIGDRLTGLSGVTVDYDLAGRMSKTVGAATTRFLYDGPNLIAEYDSAGTTLLRRYVAGPRVDETLVWYEGSSTADRRWLVADERGSIVGVSNSSGVGINVNSYDPYGVGTPAGRFGYTGQAFVPELGMYNYKARIYAPSLGRFMQTDPIGYGAGMNLYAYVAGDPINRNDPFGLKKDDLPQTTKTDDDEVDSAVVFGSLLGRGFSSGGGSSGLGFGGPSRGAPVTGAAEEGVEVEGVVVVGTPKKPVEIAQFADPAARIYNGAADCVTCHTSGPLPVPPLPQAGPNDPPPAYPPKPEDAPKEEPRKGATEKPRDIPTPTPPPNNQIPPTTPALVIYILAKIFESLFIH